MWSLFDYAKLKEAHVLELGYVCMLPRPLRHLILDSVAQEQVY